MVSGLYDAARLETNWETGAQMEFRAEQAAWMYNVLVSTDAKQTLVSTTLSPPLWRDFVDSFTSDLNIWLKPQETNAFEIVGGDPINFEAWQLTTRQDGNSVFAFFRCSDPTQDDFYLLPDSPFWRMQSDACRFNVIPEFCTVLTIFRARNFLHDKI